MCILSKFAETLSALMCERNIKAPALAKILKTDRSNITRYLHGDRLPLFHGFIALLDFFNVSADVLLGLADYSATQEFSPVAPFSSRLRTVMDETKTSQYALVKNANVSGASLYQWLFGKSVPSVESLVKLATYMDVSVDYLLGRTK